MLEKRNKLGFVVIERGSVMTGFAQHPEIPRLIPLKVMDFLAQEVKIRERGLEVCLS